MNKTYFLAALILTVTSLTNPPLAKAENFNDSTIIGTMKCVREIIEKNLGGREGLLKSANFIKTLEYLESADNTLVKDCNNTKNRLEAISISERQRQDFIEKVIKKDFSSQVYKVIEGFSAPIANCSKVGVSASAAVWLIGLGLKVDGAYCKATNGRHWLQVSPGIAYVRSPAIDAQLSFNKGTLERTLGSTGLWDFQRTIWGNAGALYTRFAEEEPNDNHEDTADVRGAGLGLTGSKGLVGQINLAILPLGTKSSLILDQYNFPKTMFNWEDSQVEESESLAPAN